MKDKTIFHACTYCDKLVIARGLCRNHYQQNYYRKIQHKKPLFEEKEKPEKEKCCLCERIQLIKGFCNRHYQQHYRKSKR